MRLLAILLVTMAAVLAQDAAQIIRESLSRDFNNTTRLQNYSFLERNLERRLDGNGKIIKSESETFDILILGGRGYRKRVATNDKPLSARDAEREQQKLDKEAERRRNESTAERAKATKRREEQRKFLQEIPAAFDLKLLGTEQLSGKPTWIIQATPKTGYKPRLSDAKVLTKVRAKLWIDQSDYQWVKVEADVLDTLSFGLGLLRVAPGARMSFTQMRMNNEIWVPRSISVRADARVGYLKKLRAEIQIDYSGYKRFQSESRLLEQEPVEVK